MSKAMTAEEALEDFLLSCRVIVNRCARLEDETDKRKIQMAVSGIFAMIDGTSSSFRGSFDLVMSVDEEHKKDCIENDEDYYVDGQLVNASTYIRNSVYEDKGE